jgi:hypothetical protein
MFITIFLTFLVNKNLKLQIDKISRYKILQVLPRYNISVKNLVLTIKNDKGHQK